MSHLKLILLQGILAFLGLLFYLIVASYFNWIEPIWWGGEALLFTVFLGAMPVLISAAIFYTITIFFKFLNFSSYFHRITASIFLGLLFSPSFEIFVKIKKAIPCWKELNPLWAMAFGLGLTSAIDITITIVLAFILFRNYQFENQSKQ